MSLTYHCLTFQELTLRQLYELLALRQEVFVVEQHCPYLDADGLDEQALHVLGVTAAGRLATYTRILGPRADSEGKVAIGRVVTAPFARGQGYGRELMEVSIHFAQKHHGAIPIKISAQSHLQAYYRSVGFKAIGEGYLEDGIPHIGMVYNF